MHYYDAVNKIQQILKTDNTWANLIYSAKQNGRVLDPSLEILKTAIRGELNLMKNQEFEEIWEECESEYMAKSGKKTSDINLREKREVVANRIEWDLEEGIYDQGGIS